MNNETNNTTVPLTYQFEIITPEKANEYAILIDKDTLKGDGIFGIAEVANKEKLARLEYICKAINGYAGLEELNGVLVEALKDLVNYETNPVTDDKHELMIQKAKAALSKAGVITL